MAKELDVTFIVSLILVLDSTVPASYESVFEPSIMLLLSSEACTCNQYVKGSKSLMAQNK